MGCPKTKCTKTQNKYNIIIYWSLQSGQQEKVKDKPASTSNLCFACKKRPPKKGTMYCSDDCMLSHAKHNVKPSILKKSLEKVVRDFFYIYCKQYHYCQKNDDLIHVVNPRYIWALNQMPNQTHLLTDGYSADDVCVKQQKLYVTNGDKVHSPS